MQRRHVCAKSRRTIKEHHVNKDDSKLNVYASPNADSAPRALYIHVPFCIHRCGYCDFTLVANKDDLIPSYLTALERELQQQSEVFEVDTVFVGGGTPSQLSAEQLNQLFASISRHFTFAQDAEVTMEANPDGLNQDKLQAIADMGVNRLSLGVQSFDQQILTTLERQHSPESASEVLSMAVRVFDNVSLDLIFGVPGQSEQTWEETLRVATQLPLQHLSTYGLTFEKGTEFFSRQLKGDLQRVPEETERSMYASAMSALKEADYQHYEISNFARLHRECRHNMVYWNADEYFAFGPGAARYINGVRSTNARSVTRWLNSWLRGRPALQETERLTDDEKVREAMFLGLRKLVGIGIAEFEQRWHVDPRNVDRPAFAANTDHGLLEVDRGFLRLTKEGQFLADSVVSDFL